MNIKRLFTKCLVSALLFQSLFIPVHATTVTAGQFNVSWKTIQATSTSTVSVPTDDWQLIGQANNGALGTFQLSMIEGDRWVSANQEAAGALGLDSTQTTELIERAASNSPLIVTRFAPDSAQARVSVYKTIRTPNGTVGIYEADFTPHHGEYLKAARMFLTNSEKAIASKVGYNPFQVFRGANDDPTFYNLSFGAAQVATGWAMAYHRSATAVFIETTSRINQTQTKSGGLLKKKITTTTTGYAKARVYVATPLEASPHRNNVSPATFGAICATGAATCDDEAHVAMSGIVLDHFKGGNIPDVEDQVYQHVKVKSSFTGLFFALFTAFAAWGIGTMMSGSAGWGAGGAGAGGAGTTAAGGTALSGGAGLGGAQIGLYAGVGYAAINTLVNGGPLTSAQSGWLGNMGWSPADITNGVITPDNCQNSEHCTGTRTNILNRHVQPDLGANSNHLSTTSQTLFGTCAPGVSAAICGSSGQASGIIPRTDGYTEVKGTQLMQARISSCKAQGLTGVALRKCIAPQPTIPN
jgi:hypothetical protein